jgi:hypothetical protein
MIHASVYHKKNESVDLGAGIEAKFLVLRIDDIFSRNLSSLLNFLSFHSFFLFYQLRELPRLDVYITFTSSFSCVFLPRSKAIGAQIIRKN